MTNAGGKNAKGSDRAEIGAHTRERAEFWCCRIRTMQLMKADGVPVDDVGAMVEWHAKLPLRSQGMLTPDFKRRIFEERAKLEGTTGAGPLPSLDDPDVAEFDKSYRPTSAGSDNLAEIRRERDFYLFKLRKARARRDPAGEAEAGKQHRAYSQVVHEAELHAQRLGRDLGESFSAADVDRLGRAIGFWLMSSADGLISQIATELTKAAGVGPLDRERVRLVVDPLVIAERVVVPMVRASQVNAGCALPSRFVDALKAGVACVVEDGEAEFARLYVLSPRISKDAPAQELPAEVVSVTTAA